MATKKTTNKDLPVAVPTEKEKIATEKETKVKKTWKFNDSTLVNVQSNVHGELIFVDDKTGDTVIWSEFGDIQPMTIGSLRSMRGTQKDFYENNWIFVNEVIDDEFEGAEPDDVYKFLMVSQYYKDALDPDNFYRIFEYDDEQLEKAVKRLSASGRMNLVVAANEAIRNGSFDSFRKIRLLEEMLGCELVEMT